MTEAPDETMRWIWEVKRKISDELEGLTDEEIVEYFKQHSKRPVTTPDDRA